MLSSMGLAAYVAVWLLHAGVVQQLLMHEHVEELSSIMCKCYEHAMSGMLTGVTNVILASWKS